MRQFFTGVLVAIIIFILLPPLAWIAGWFLARPVMWWVRYWLG